MFQKVTNFSFINLIFLTSTLVKSNNNVIFNKLQSQNQELSSSQILVSNTITNIDCNIETPASPIQNVETVRGKFY